MNDLLDALAVNGTEDVAFARAVNACNWVCQVSVCLPYTRYSGLLAPPEDAITAGIGTDRSRLAVAV